jgi:hypothetical protein
MSGGPWAKRVIKEGFGNVIWDGTDRHGLVTPAGVYFYRVQMGTGESQGRVVLLR